MTAAVEAHHVSVQLVPFDALLQEGLLLSNLHRGALVQAHKVQVVQLALLNTAPLCQLVVGRHQQNQLILSIRHCLHQTNVFSNCCRLAAVSVVRAWRFECRLAPSAVIVLCCPVYKQRIIPP